jgi:hypothetical protein
MAQTLQWEVTAVPKLLQYTYKYVISLELAQDSKTCKYGSPTMGNSGRALNFTLEYTGVAL